MSLSKYHILTQMARDVLASQVSTVTYESSFSTGRRVLDSFQSSLNPVMVQALICYQNWIRSSSLPLDMSSVPEEIDTYQSYYSGNYFILVKNYFIHLTFSFICFSFILQMTQTHPKLWIFIRSRVLICKIYQIYILLCYLDHITCNTMHVGLKKDKKCQNMNCILCQKNS